MKKLFSLSLCLLIVLIAGTIYSFDMNFWGPNQLKNGAWLEYKITKTDFSGKSSNGSSKLSIVGEEKDNNSNSTYYWYELVEKSSDKVMKYKMLSLPLSVDNTNIKSSDIKALILQRGNEQPVRIKLDLLKNSNEPKVDVQKEDLGTEQITVPAGTFSTQHIKIKSKSSQEISNDELIMTTTSYYETDYWLADIQGMGKVVVKQSSNSTVSKKTVSKYDTNKVLNDKKESNSELRELVKSSKSGAKSEITGTPKDVDTLPDGWK